MPQLEYFVAAHGALVDQGTNLVTLYNVLEDVTPRRYPFTMDLTAVAGWRTAPDERHTDYQAIVRLHAPGNGAPRDFPANLSTQGRPKFRLIMRIVQVNVTAPGTLSIELLLNGVHQAFHTIDVHPAAEQAAAPA
jgi:hypothetical protein